MRRVEPYRLWVGHAGDSRSFRTLFEVGIRAVVQLAVEEPPLAPPRELTLVRVPVADGGGNDQNLLRLAITALATLIRSEVPTLVCCSAGMSRSPAIIAAALSSVESASPEDCLRRVACGAPADVSPALWEEIKAVLLQGSHEF